MCDVLMRILYRDFVFLPTSRSTGHTKDDASRVAHVTKSLQENTKHDPKLFNEVLFIIRHPDIFSAETIVQTTDLARAHPYFTRKQMSNITDPPVFSTNASFSKQNHIYSHEDNKCE